MRSIHLLWPQQIGMDPCPANPCKIEMEAFTGWGLKISGDEFNIRIDCFHLLQSGIPVLIQIGWFGVYSLIFT